MCQRVLISKNIANISTRSFERNLEAVSGMEISMSKLTRLNGSIDALYELLYRQFNEIDKTDYMILEPQIKFLLKTIKDLYSTYKMIALKDPIKREVNRLWNNYSALFELNDDLKRFRIKKQDTSDDLSASFQRASSIMSKI